MLFPRFLFSKLLRRRVLNGFKHIWVWRPFRSTNRKHLNKNIFHTSTHIQEKFSWYRSFRGGVIWKCIHLTLIQRSKFVHLSWRWYIPCFWLMKYQGQIRCISPQTFSFCFHINAQESLGTLRVNLGPSFSETDRPWVINPLYQVSGVQFSRFWRSRFPKVSFPYMVLAVILDQETITIWANFRYPNPERLNMKHGYNWACWPSWSTDWNHLKKLLFIQSQEAKYEENKKMFENVDVQQTTDACLYFKPFPQVS